MAEEQELRAFQFHWRAAGLSETTLRYCVRWLRRFDVDDSMTDQELAARLVEMTPSQRHYALRAARAWGRWRGTGLGKTLKTPKQVERPQPTAAAELVQTALAGSGENAPPWDVRAAAVVALLWSTGMRVGEAAALRWPDVDLERRLVRVSGSKARSFRLAALDGVAVERLRAWRALETVESTTVENEGYDTTGRVFPVNSRTLQRDGTTGQPSWCITPPPPSTHRRLIGERRPRPDHRRPQLGGGGRIARTRGSSRRPDSAASGGASSRA
jgi:integrase